MKSSLRVLAKASFLLCVLALLIAGLVLAWFASWRSDKLSALDSASEIAETDQGKVEYLIRGEGPTVLVFHGAPGGYDQGMLLGSIFAEEEFAVVAPSRPGYLRTPLATGQSPEQQADAMAALMQTMGIPGVAVLASSYGAPAAVQFVLRHPEKVWALVLLSPVMTKFDAKLPWTEPGRLVFDKFGEDFGAWLAVEAVERDPQTILKRILEAENGGLRPNAMRWRNLFSMTSISWNGSAVSLGRSCRGAPERAAFATISSRFVRWLSFPLSRSMCRRLLCMERRTSWCRFPRPSQSQPAFRARRSIRSREPATSLSLVRGLSTCKRILSSFSTNVPGANPNPEDGRGDNGFF